MIEVFKNIINYLGISNALSIVVFLIGLFIAFYFYYRSFFRLIYSTERISKTCNTKSEWTNNKAEFVTRILFFNNGRKTITRNEICKLELVTNGKINFVKTLKVNDNIKLIKSIDNVIIEIDYIDSSDFFVLEVNHNGQLEVKGRISETGKILNTEPKKWLALNFFIVIFFILMIFYNTSLLMDDINANILKVGINFSILIAMFVVIRFIHSIFFIPDRKTSKYLATKDKFAKEFKY